MPALSGAQPSGVTPDLLLREFTTDPPPRVTTRTEGEYLIQIFNTENGGGGGGDGRDAKPFDVDRLQRGPAASSEKPQM